MLKDCSMLQAQAQYGRVVTEMHWWLVVFGLYMHGCLFWILCFIEQNQVTVLITFWSDLGMQALAHVMLEEQFPGMYQMSS